MGSTIPVPPLDDLPGCYRYCRGVTHLYGANFSVGFRRLPRAKREAVYAVYAFCRFADDIADEDTGAKDPRVLLERWERALEGCYRGVANHPILVALADAATRYPIRLDSFRRLIEGCRMDLQKVRYETFDELLVYCDRVAATISELSLAIFGWTDPRTPAWGRALSTALQLTNILRDVAEDAHRGRVYIPRQELELYGCEEADLSASHPSPAFLHLMEFQLERVFRHFDLARPLCSAVSADSRVAVALMGSVYRAVALAISRDIPAVLTARVRLTAGTKCCLVAAAELRNSAHRMGFCSAPCW